MNWDPMVREGLDSGSILVPHLLPLLGAWEGSGLHRSAGGSGS